MAWETQGEGPILQGQSMPEQTNGGSGEFAYGQWKCEVLVCCPGQKRWTLQVDPSPPRGSNLDVSSILEFYRSISVGSPQWGLLYRREACLPLMRFTVPHHLLYSDHQVSLSSNARSRLYPVDDRSEHQTLDWQQLDPSQRQQGSAQGACWQDPKMFVRFLLRLLGFSQWGGYLAHWREEEVHPRWEIHVNSLVGCLVGHCESISLWQGLALPHLEMSVQ